MGATPADPIRLGWARQRPTPGARNFAGPGDMRFGTEGDDDGDDGDDTADENADGVVMTMVLVMV